jgi:hypothetical protein
MATPPHPTTPKLTIYQHYQKKLKVGPIGPVFDADFKYDIHFKKY